MNLITNITSDPLQTQLVQLPDGSTFSFTMYYIPMQYGWFFTNITYNNFILNGVRIVNHPNLLYQYQNQIPFGISCFTLANREPTQQQDFSSGASKLFLLSQQDVQAYTAWINGGALPS